MSYFHINGRFFMMALVTVLSVMLSQSLYAEEIGSVSTKFKLMGANDTIVVEAFDDPLIPGATCHLSRARTGGMSGSLGLAEDTSDASIACRQTGAITLPSRVRSGEFNGQEVFKKSTSILFKSLQVVRFYDAKRKTLIYLSYSDKLVDGSPKNSISTIPVMNWQQ